MWTDPSINIIEREDRSTKGRREEEVGEEERRERERDCRS